MFSVQQQTLPNKLRLYTTELVDTQAVSVLFLVGVGSRNEEDEQSGVSHLLEHMVFKGTEKYPTTKILSQKLDAVGAEFNAFTSEEFTGFWVRAAAEHAPLAIDIITDLVFRPRLNAGELKKEQGVVLEEIKMYRDMPQSHVGELNQQILFRPSTLGRPIIGTAESVSALTAEALGTWQARWYQPRNIVAVVAGNPLQYDWSALIEERVKNYTPREVDSYLYGEFSPSGPHVLGEERSTDQAHLMLGFRTVSYHDQRKFTAWTLSNLLGQMMSSRLFLEVRERRGLAYYIGSSPQEFSDTGMLQVRAGVDPKKAVAALKVIARELTKLTKEPPAAGELNRAKENLKGEMILHLEDSMAIARFVGQQALLLGTVRTPQEIFADIEAVSATHIKTQASQFFTRKNLHFSFVGPLKSQSQLLAAIAIPG